MLFSILAGVYTLLKRYRNLGIIRDLIIVIFPFHDKFLALHIKRDFSIVFNLSVKFNSMLVFGLIENQISSVLNKFVCIVMFFRCLGKLFAVKYCCPKGTISVFPILSFSTENSPNFLNKSIAKTKDLIFFKNKVVSSANCNILNSSSFIVIPFIFFSDLIPIVIISATNMNNSADIGHLCLIPRFNWK